MSLAALGSVLIAGSQLSDLGALDPGTERFKQAVTGGALAVAGILMILAVTVRTMATPVLTIGGLAQKNPKWFQKSENATILGNRTLTELATAYEAAITATNVAYQGYLASDPPAREELKTKFKLQDANLQNVDRDVTRVLEVALFRTVAFRWYVCFAVSIVGASLAAAGIGLFAWASNPPEDAVASTASSNVLTTPSQAKLRLTPEGKAALSEPLNCTKDEISVLLLAKTAPGSDVLVQDQECVALRVLVGPGWGTVA